MRLPCQYTANKGVQPPPLRSMVRAVVEFDGQHEPRGDTVTKNKVDVLFCDGRPPSMGPYGVGTGGDVGKPLLAMICYLLTDHHSDNGEPTD